MKQKKEPVRFSWDGPLPDREVPDDILYDLVLRIQHDAGDEAPEAVAEALAPLGGRPTVRRIPLLGPRIAWKHGKIPLKGRIVDGTIEVAVGHRLKGKALTRLVEALRDVPGARDLEIDAQEPYYTDGSEDIRPCSPCAAKSYPRR